MFTVPYHASQPTLFLLWVFASVSAYFEVVLLILFVCMAFFHPFCNFIVLSLYFLLFSLSDGRLLKQCSMYAIFFCTVPCSHFFLFNLRFAFSFISYSVSFACFSIPTSHLPDYCCRIPGSFLEKLKNVRNAHVCRSTWNVLATSKLNLHVWCYGEIYKFWPIVPLLLPAVSNGLWKMKTCYANVPWKFHIKVSCMCVYVRNPRKWM